ncbi:hypothetical protein KRX54_02800 [Actinomycetaceae bacterium TAE3-ERU4]|nr:hypothetical protein [Actinomycetaceae bacterium TAE3-ERU4]
MTNGADFQQVAQAASDPNVNLEYLRQIAASYPGLRPVIAMNPATYPDLLKWLESLNDPQVNAALEERKRAIAAGVFGAHLAPPVTPAPASAPMPVFAPTASASASEPQTAASGLAAVNSEVSEGSSKRAVFLILALVLAALVIGFAVAIFTGVINLGGSQKAAPVASATVEKQVIATPSTPTEKTPEEAEPTPEDEIRYPAPADAQAVPKFISPSQNIGCVINKDYAYCSIRTREYLTEGPGACQGVFGLKVNASGEAVQTCNDEANKAISESFPTLEYGKASKVGDYACTMESSGVTCWNMKTGYGFNMRRADFSAGKR